ncbi:MAG TPA: metalloregulator ArsR/SmtB family transcription factor [Anaerolineae bacterium]|nr:metalloregulator ArsR/SmtB family transcription factor [Anaerolineae bacterium]
MLSRTRRRRHPRSFEQLHEYFRTLSDTARLDILGLLAVSSHDLTVSDMARRLDISQPLCSWHIRRLVKLGIVRMRRVGREAHCSLDRTRLAEYEQAFSNLLAPH